MAIETPAGGGAACAGNIAGLGLSVTQLGEIEAFAAALHGIETKADFLRVIAKYGVPRTHPLIWEHFDWFVEYMKRKQPVEAGVYDLNRYRKLSEFH